MKNKFLSSIFILALSGSLLAGCNSTSLVDPSPSPSTSSIVTETKTVTFKADDVVVSTLTYERGQTSIVEPAVPLKDYYTGVWEEYDLSLFIDIVVNAIYTPTTYHASFYVDNVLYDTIDFTYFDNDRTVPSVPSKLGYKEGVWSPAVTFDVFADARYDAVYECELVFPSGEFVCNNDGSWSASHDSSIGIYDDKQFETGTYSILMHKSTGSEDSGIVFRASSSSEHYWEGEGTSYYFFFMNKDGNAYLAKSVNGVWSQLGLAQIFEYNEESDYPLAVSISSDNVICCFVGDNLVIECQQEEMLPGLDYGYRASKSGTTYKEISIVETVREENMDSASWQYACGNFTEEGGVLTTNVNFTMAYAKGVVVEEGKMYETDYTAGVNQDAGIVIGVNPNENYRGWEYSRNYHAFVINFKEIFLFAALRNGGWHELSNANLIKDMDVTHPYKLGVQVKNGMIRCFVDGVFFGELPDEYDSVGKMIGVRATVAGAKFTNMTVRDVTTTVEWYQRSGQMTYDETNDTLYGYCDGCLAWSNDKRFTVGKRITFNQISSEFKDDGFVFGGSDAFNSRWEERQYYYVALRKSGSTVNACLCVPGIGNLYSIDCTAYLNAANEGNKISVEWKVVSDNYVISLYLNDTSVFEYVDSTLKLSGDLFGFRSTKVGISWSNISITDL